MALHIQYKVQLQFTFYECRKIYHIIIRMQKISTEEIIELVHKHLPQYTKQSMTVQTLMGMTNVTVKVTSPGLQPLVVKYLSDIFDRKKENIIINELSAQGVSPKIYYACEEYRIQQFVINASHPQCSQIYKENNNLMKMIIQALQEFHKIDLPEEIERNNVLDDFFERKNYEAIMQISKPPEEDQKEFNDLKKKLAECFKCVKQLFCQHFFKKKKTVKYCHNDMNNLNIFVLKNQEKAKLIDYEYSGYNYIAYDLANFLNQFTFDYLEIKPGFCVRAHITKQDIKRACSYYSNSYQGLEEDVMRMLVICNFYWGIWCLTIHRTQSNPNFEPLKHGQSRIELLNFYKNQLADN